MSKLSPREIEYEIEAVLDEMNAPPDRPDAAWRLDLAMRLQFAGYELIRDDLDESERARFRNIMEPRLGSAVMPLPESHDIEIPFDRCRAVN